LSKIKFKSEILVSEKVKNQYEDNFKWIKEAHSHNLVVGSKARILYSDREGRMLISLAMNKLVRDGVLKGPVVISRDHHDVSGTDSPFRETSNVYDGSAFTADMAVQNFAGDGFRGATWIALHNGGGVGWGEGEYLQSLLCIHDFVHIYLNFKICNYLSDKWRLWNGIGWI
jgi:urocanate hydratase